MYKAIILDRDGVINADSPGYIRTVNDWHPLPGSLDAIARLNRAGYPIAIATNQAGVGRRLIRTTDLNAIHARLVAEVNQRGGTIGTIEVCTHLPGSGCNCRKPRPGLLHQGALSLGVTVAACLFVGDSPRDQQAALQAGCAFAWISSAGEHPDHFRSLAELADFLLKNDEGMAG